MKETTALYPRVHAACDAILKEEGVLPTADAVVERIGGSKKTAHAGRLQWIAQLSDRLNWVQGMPDIPAEASEAMLALWGALSKANDTKFEVRKTEVEQLLDEAEQRIQAAKHDRDVANDNLKQALGQVQAVEAEKAQLERALDKETGRREEIEGMIEQIRSDAASRVAAMQHTVDELHANNDRLSSEVALLTDQLRTANNNVLDARKDRDMVSERLDAVREELANAKAELKGCLAENSILKKQNEAFHTTLKNSQ